LSPPPQIPSPNHQTTTQATVALRYAPNRKQQQPKKTSLVRSPSLPPYTFTTPSKKKIMKET